MNKQAEIFEATNGGFVITTVDKGMHIANTVDELKAIVGMAFGQAAPAAPPAPPVATPEDKVVPITAAPTPPPAAPAPSAGSSSQFGTEYDAEVQRILTEDDRKAAQTRIQTLIDSGMILESDFQGKNWKRFKTDKLVDTFKAGDAKAAQGGAPMPPAAPVPPAPPAPPAPVPPAPPAPVPPAPPAPPAPVPPAPGAVTLADVTAALQAVAQKDPKEGPATAYAIMNKWGGTKVSELEEKYWPSVIAEANAAVAG